MAHLYHDDLASLKDDGSLDPNTTDDTDEEGPMVPEEDFEEDKVDDEEDSY